MMKFIKLKYIFIAMLIILINVFIGSSLFQKSETSEISDEKINKIAKEVSILKLDKNLQSVDIIKTSGIVKAGSKVDVISLGDGQVTNLNFKIGSSVFSGQILATLYDNSVKNSKESLENAKIVLKTAENNYNNNISLRGKTDTNIQEDAIITFNSSLNTISNALNEVDYIINVENKNQLPGIEKTLSILNSQFLTNAKNNYIVAKNSFNSLSNLEISKNNTLSSIELIIEGLNLTKKSIDYTISVLNNTIPSATLNETTLNTQKNSFSALRATVITAHQSALNDLQGLENLDTARKKDLDVLKNSVEQAKSQVELAQIAYNNLLSDLTIIATISGQITQKFIELGSKINPGQKIAEISQTNLVKIEINLSSNDIYKIKLGQKAILDDNLYGTISHIDPVADSISRKVKVEISFDNKKNPLQKGNRGKSLIPETFIDVIIPVEQKQVLNSDVFLIPIKALAITQNENFVFIAEQDKAKKILVEIGKPKGYLIEIIKGLNIGDKLIIEGNKNLKDNENINIQNIE